LKFFWCENELEEGLDLAGYRSFLFLGYLLRDTTNIDKHTWRTGVITI